MYICSAWHLARRVIGKRETKYQFFLTVKIEVLDAALIQAYNNLHAQGLGIANGFRRKFPKGRRKTQFIFKFVLLPFAA
jgi:hypothetical protein